MNHLEAKKADPGQLTNEQQVMVDALAAALLKASGQNQSAQQKRTELPPEGKTIDLIELFYYVVGKLYLVLIAAVIGAVAMGWYAEKSVVPIYTATAKLYIVGSQGASILTDLQIGTQLKMDYEEVFKTWEVHEMVRAELGLEYGYSALQGMLTVTNPEDTRVLYITVRNANPQLAADLANAYAHAGKEFILKTMDSDEPNIFSVALVPTTAYMRSTTSSVLLGFMGGSVLMAGILVLIFLFDDRPRTPEHIEQAAGIPTLTVMPSAAKRSTRRGLMSRRRTYYYYEAH